MITDKKLTDWLFYYSRYSEALDINEYSDPKYLELNFPYRKDFCDKLLECSLEEYVSTLVWIFKDKYPLEYRYIEIFQLEDEGDKKRLLYNTNIRSAQDIYPLEFKEDEEVVGYLHSLKIKFKEPQPLAENWVEQAIEGKTYEKEHVDNVAKYTVQDSVIETLEVTESSVLINVNQKRIDESFRY